ncbi:SDR family NAD(P)-dependent oxidoreductase [Paraconexibacter sp.]|uniref:SDR family NAD(P)-dependent oxidoreductase n=1 Tax=Paraconexibacter sp. TaxID=2949640 RepID=UPI003565CB53
MATRVKLSGRTAVVTGAASGIGRASARLLAQRGCPLVLVDKDEAGLAETAEGLTVPVMTRTMDVSDRWAQQQLAAEVKDWQGPIGLVLNNAGVTVSQTIAESSSEDLEWVMGVNLWGVVHGTQAYLPILLEQDSGVIANISSIFGIIAWPTQAIYNASKFAVKGFTESLRHELHETNVSAVCIHPGGIATNIVNNARIHQDDLGRTDPEALRKDFEKVAKTSPDKAAKTIVEGIEKGKVRILIGPDAVATDVLARTLPVNYFSVIRKLQPLIRR